MEVRLSEQKSSKNPAFPFILTGNDLLVGDVVYFDGSGWVRDPKAAFVAEDDAAAARLVGVRDAALDVVEPYLVATGAGGRAGAAPVHYREKIRLIGPTFERASHVPL
jgi:hypothetical protein